MTIIARAKPERSKKYGQKICCAAWSPLHRRWFRLYPVPVLSDLKRWSVWEARLRRNPGDGRDISWRIDCDGTDIEDAMEMVGEADRDRTFRDMKLYAATDFAALNACRLSMAAVRPHRITDIRLEELDGPEREAASTLGLWQQDEPPLTHGPVLRPRLFWEDEGGYHNAILLEWGCSLLVNERGYSTAEDLADALRLNESGRDWLIVAGNMCNHRTTYMAITLLSVKNRQPSLWEN